MSILDVSDILEETVSDELVNLVNVEAKRHQGNAQTALLWSLACLWTHVQCFNCQL